MIKARLTNATKMAAFGFSPQRPLVAGGGFEPPTFGL